MKKHGFYLHNGHIKKFRYGQAIAINKTESLERIFIQDHIPPSILQQSINNPNAFVSVNEYMHHNRIIA